MSIIEATYVSHHHEWPLRNPGAGTAAAPSFRSIAAAD